MLALIELLLLCIEKLIKDQYWLSALSEGTAHGEFEDRLKVAAVHHATLT